LNISVDLGVHGRDNSARSAGGSLFAGHDETNPSIEPVSILVRLRISRAFRKCSTLPVIPWPAESSGNRCGVVPPGIEGSGQDLAELLATIGRAGKGLELVSCVNDIPKARRLAVSTNLLAG